MTTCKVALVTGGTRGIGLGIARRLAADGFSVAMTGRRGADEVEQALAEVREQCRARDQRARYWRADVAAGSERQRLLAEMEEELGRLDVLVNNAGIAPNPRADILEASEASFDELVATNLKGPYFLTQAAAKWMIRQQEEKRERRSIINVSSVSATVASVNRGDYCITKAGVAMATKLWATRLTEYGIGVYEVRPGIIETDMTRGAKSKYDAMMEGDALLERRWGTPDDVGAAVAVLARGDLPYAPGLVVVVDGGLTLPRL
jgi:3-oxoacyl-[acyl-carrier protein] reductase